MANTNPANPSTALMRKNEGRLYAEDDLLKELNTRYRYTFNSSNAPLGQKNLIYFTINYSDSYIDLFTYCLRSIVNKDKNDAFDLLVICSPLFKIKINKLIDDGVIDLKGFNLLFHYVPEAEDGIEASMNKLKIYQFKNINDYGKVLFLDVDIMAKEPISELFNLELDPDIFYSAIHSYSDHLHNTKFHKLVDYDLAKMNEFRDKEIYAFNAGQYLFVNSVRMLRHLYNVDWLSRAWPGEYFFEQAFLNHYFNWFCISNVHLLASYVKFVSVHLWARADSLNQYKMSYSIVHFAGHACDAAKKIDFIRQFHPDLISNSNDTNPQPPPDLINTMSNCLLSHCNFVHIPKCGGTTLNTALWRLGAITDKSQEIRTPHYGHLFASQMPENGKPFFSFVRHPVTWWMSFYHWNMNPAHSRFSSAELATTSFDEWLKDYGQFWLGHYTTLVRRYLGKDLNFPTNNKVELIGRTEHMFSDLRNLLNVIGQPYKANVMKDLISGKLKLDPAHTNTQTYDRNAISMESRETIKRCEQFMYTTFGYKI